MVYIYFLILSYSHFIFIAFPKKRQYQIKWRFLQCFMFYKTYFGMLILGLRSSKDWKSPVGIVPRRPLSRSHKFAWEWVQPVLCQCRSPTLAINIAQLQEYTFKVFIYEAVLGRDSNSPPIRQRAVALHVTPQ